MTNECAIFAAAVLLSGAACGVQGPESLPPRGASAHAGNAGSSGGSIDNTTSGGGTGSIGGSDSPVGNTAGSSATGGGAGDRSSGMGGSTAGSAPVEMPDVYIPPPVSTVTCPSAPVGGTDVHIADFEDGLNVIGKDGRGGVWFGYSDGSGMQTDHPIPVAASDKGGKALHLTGGGYSNWGSGIGCSLAHDFNANVQCPYDASAFKGVKVTVKGSGSVRLRVEEIATTPILATDRKGSCDGFCDGHYEVVIALTSEWTEHSYAWSELVQPFGTPATFDPKTVLGLNFEFNPGTSYDMWLDNVEFTK